MKRILNEPLLHFFLLGAALFIVYGQVQEPGSGVAPGKIVVTVGQIEHLAAGFAKIWQREPDELETKRLIDEWVREEIATREAMALGLDKGDIVIRRRLRQKLEFVSDDIAAQTEPTEGELDAYLRAYPETFRIEPQFTFSQVYLDPAKHRENLTRDSAKVLAQLRQAGSGGEAADLGDSLLLGRNFAAAPISAVKKQFGENFAAKINELPPGQWHGPIESGYGVHFVFISERTESRLPKLAEVHESVHREWANTQRLEANSNFYQKLLKQYAVTIERPAPADVQRKVVAAR